MVFEDPEQNKRPRVKETEIDEKLVQGILAEDPMVRDDWLIQALKSQSTNALAAAEEAISRLVDQPDISFYQTGGKVSIDPASRKHFAGKVLELAEKGKMLDDIIRTQSYMAAIGDDENSILMRGMQAISPQSLHAFQLLGVQMQLAIMVERSAKGKEPPQE